MAGVAGRAVLNGFKSVVSAASDAQQSLGATQTVFGKYGDTVVSDSNRAAKAYGLSANVYRENANLIGSLFKNQGVATSQLAGKTKGMIATASDLAATFGGTTTSAVEALGSAFKGEFDPLEKYGISLKQSTVNAEAMRVANVKSASEFGKLSTAQQTAAKQQATSNLIMKQSKDSAGAFGRESNTLAHQQQVLAAQFDNVKAAIGTRLLPILTKFLTFLTTKGPKAISAFKDMAKPVTEFFNKFKGGSGQASGSLTKFLATAKSVWTSVQSVIQSAVAIIQALWRMFGATILANIQSTFNNLMLVIRGAFQVIKGIFDVFAGILTGDWKRVWTGIKSIFTGVVNILKGGVKQLWNIIATAFRAGGAVVKALFRGAWNAIKSVASSAWNGIKSVVSKGWSSLKSATSTGISKVVSTVKGLPGKVKSAVGDLGGLLKNAGKQIIQGLLDGINSMIGKVKDKLKSLTNMIPDLKGPLTYDKVMLKPAGQAIIQGLINGIDDKEAALVRKLKATTSLIASGVNPSINGGLGLATAATARTNVTIKVEVPVGADPVTIGREIDKVLNKFYDATGGKRR